MDISIIVNGIPFTEIRNSRFIVYGEKDLVPFCESLFRAIPYPHREYKALIFNGRFYAPKVNSLKDKNDN